MQYLLAVLLLTFNLSARAEEPGDLLDEVTKMDTKLFDAFNACDLK